MAHGIGHAAELYGVHGAAPRPCCSLLSAVNLGRSFLAQQRAPVAQRELRTFAWQTVVILTLYLIRFQSPDGLWTGFKVSWQLFLAYLPAMVFPVSISQAGMVRMMTRIMPAQMAFVLSTCIRFVPQLLAEIQSIYEGQVLRGSRILPRDLLRPWHWPDLLPLCRGARQSCRAWPWPAISSLTARARGFGRSRKRRDLLAGHIKEKT